MLDFHEVEEIINKNLKKFKKQYTKDRYKEELKYLQSWIMKDVADKNLENVQRETKIAIQDIERRIQGV